MSRILVVGEDALSCALGERLVGSALPDRELAGPSINTKGLTKLVAALPRYLQPAKHVQPVLCVADTDGKCSTDDTMKINLNQVLTDQPMRAVAKQPPLRNVTSPTQLIPKPDSEPLADHALLVAVGLALHWSARIRDVLDRRFQKGSGL